MLQKKRLFLILLVIILFSLIFVVNPSEVKAADCCEAFGTCYTIPNGVCTIFGGSFYSDRNCDKTARSCKRKCTDNCERGDTVPATGYGSNSFP